jgi:uncharacterized protein YkwD
MPPPARRPWVPSLLVLVASAAALGADGGARSGPPAGGGELAGDDLARAGRLDDLALRFARADAAELERLAERFRAEGARGELVQALEARWAKSVEALQRDAGMKRLARLSERRRALDEARAEALALIFDEEQYFYPYDPPACPPERAALYPAVARRVAEKVDAVRALWDVKDSVSPGKSLSALVEVLDQLTALSRGERITLDRERVPEWLGGVDFDEPRVTVREFAWSATERAALDLDRAVLAFNARPIAAELADSASEPDAAERRQVEVTNDYRLMLGRHALAFHPALQAAAQDHSDYMARTGDFSHFEPEPEARDPFVRMRRRGYLLGQSENCATNGAPEGAHEAWLRSSGHHRNILGADHREMASAQAGEYWTQVFGGGADFQDDL